MTESTELERSYVFGPCEDGDHGQCLGALEGLRCACDCGHMEQKEREVTA